MLEDPWFEPPEDVYSRTTALENAPDTPGYVRIRFDKGRPVAVNGKKLGAVALLDKLNAIAGEHGVGRIDLVENRLVGIKSRGIYETPGGTLLYEAHRELESLVLDRDTAHYKALIAQKYADLVYNGQ